MNVRKSLTFAAFALLLAALLLGGSSPANAQGGGNNKGKITPKDRQAAAAASGLTIDTMAMTAPQIDPNNGLPVPHYFSHPNYANSPLPQEVTASTPDATVTFVTAAGDSGSGAAGTAVVDSATGSITGVTVNTSGSGYAIAPTVGFSSTKGISATATVVLSGTVTGFVPDTFSTSYTGPITVDITGDGTGAAASAVVSSAGGSVSSITVGPQGNGYTAPVVTISGDGFGAEATANVTPIGFVTAISVTAAGSGYVSPTVTIVGGDGTATADATTDANGAIVAITVTNAGTGYSAATTQVTFGDANVAAPGSGAAATAIVDEVSGPITSIDVTSPGSGYTTANVVITDPIGSGATATANITAGAGTIQLTLNNGGWGYSAPPAITLRDENGVDLGLAVAANISGGVAGVTMVDGGSGYQSNSSTITGGIRKFVDSLAGLGASGANNLGQYISVAVPDTTTYPGSDYYEIALVEYSEQLHSDLPPTKLRGYVQLATSVVLGSHNLGNGFTAVEAPHYLGAAIVAQKDRPVRIKFRNLLPTGMGGDLFIPVDSTVMGSGMTPQGHEWMMNNPDMVDPLNPMCSDANKSMMVASGHCYADSRATLHLHGGISPWISDGTPHQWITPAGENTAYPQGVSVRPVPDMSDSGNANDGVMTFYYTNQQSARLMFYHDHAYGITRLNVYAGEAAPYLIQDNTEAALVSAGLIPGANATIPLVLQDKTFVPNDAQLAQQDETWDTARWGGEGSLWVPHVYSPAQNPGDPSGVNQFGRWAYGPWFWPPTNNIEHGPVANPYYDPACVPDPASNVWCEPALMPGTPYVSMGMESFNDTPVINGTVYPTLEVDPKSYRFRILNAANDRFFNLSLYQAVDANGVPCDANNPNPAPESTGVACTEVALNPAEVAAALDDPAGVFPTPVSGTEGPDMIDIATEGGFLPAPAVVPAHPITWVTDPTVFNAGNVDQHALLTAPAERHDVIVDFSQYAGQTLILYNDAPAAFPARDPRYDYYTGNADLRDTGGAPSTLPGYGPNTRTMMQIKVKAAAPAPAFNLGALQTAFKSAGQGGMGIFENGQHPIIVGQKGYNSAYGTSFNSSDGQAQIFDTSLTFKTLLGSTLSVALKPKMIQDEMGEAFELEYGRMSGFLGVETPNAQAGLQNMILHPYSYPPDEIIDGVELPAGVEVTPIASADDGTQIWKITHNGVDTHPIHWHLYDVQLINRVGWDGIVRMPEATELGWKDTIRVSPLEDTIVALRPIIPQLPAAWNGLPNSIRLLDPTLPEGAYLMGANTTQREAAGLPLLAFNPDGEPVDIVNHYVNYGWEYVLHCHILSHEEMDMMHAQVVGIAPKAPTLVSAVRSGSGNNRRYTVTYTDNSKNETAFVIERRRAGSTDAWSTIATVQSEVFGVVPYNNSGVGAGTGTRTYVDRIGNTSTLYEYQVYAINTVGDNWDYSNPGFNEIPAGGGWPTLTLTSLETIGQPPVPPTAVAAPSGLTGTANVKNKKVAEVTLIWADNSNNETGFLVQRADNSTFTAGVVNATVAGNTTTLTQSTTRGKTYYYRVLAFNDTTQSGWSNVVTIITP